MTSVSGEDILFTWEGVTAHQQAEERERLLDSLHRTLDSLTDEQLARFQDQVTSMQAEGSSNG